MRKKWTTLYKYVSTKHLLEIINQSRLRLSDGSNFNDPFELLVTDPSSGTEEHQTGLRILCLTNSFQNKLMWSHYADSCRGVCLTIRVPRDDVYPVCYTGTRMQVGSDIDELISNSKKSKKKVLEKPIENLSEAKKIALLKDKKWAYENEFRMVFDASDTGLINEDGQWYLSVKITNIYLGVSFDENENIHRNDLIKLCKDKKIKIAEMKKSLVNYSVVIRRKGVEKNVLVQV